MPLLTHRSINQNAGYKRPQQNYARQHLTHGNDLKISHTNSLSVKNAYYTHQYVAVLSCDVRRVDAQMPCHGRTAPTGRKSTPRPFQSLEDKVAKIGLQELPQVVAELHVEVSLEHRAGATAVGW